MKNIINLAFNKYLIFILLIIYPIIITYFYSFNYYWIGGDADSYIGFSFESIKTFFSQHRSFFLPLIIKTWSFVFEAPYGDTHYLGYFLLFLFLLSVWFLYSTMINLEFNHILCGTIVYGIVFTYNLAILHSHLNTDIIGLTLFLFSVNFFITYAHKNEKKYLYFFSTLIFLCISARPSYIISMPCFVYYFYKFNGNIFKKDNFIKFVKFIFSANILIILFLLIRFIYTDSIGLISFSGVLASNHLTFLAEKSDLKHVSYENKTLIKNLIDRREKLHGKCNLSYEQAKKEQLDLNELRGHCYNEQMMSAWLESIKLNENIEPFEKGDIKNYNAWEYVPSLSKFFNLKDNVFIDSQLMSSTKEIIFLNLREYLDVVINAAIKGSLFLYFLAIKYLIILFLIMHILIKFYLEKISLSKRDKIFINFNIFHYFLLMLMTSFMNYPHPRYYLCQSILLIPCIFLYLFSKIKLNYFIKSKTYS